MKSHLRTLTLTSLMALSTQASFAADLTEARVKEIVEDYLRENPKVIIESLQNYQVQEEVRRVQEQAEALKAMGDAFGDDKNYPVAGNPDGDVQIVEFFDYNCPACKMMFEGIDELLKQDTNVRVVFVEFPIFGPQSDTNAHYALAVHALAPEKYYDFHSAMMRHKGKADEAYVLQIAKELGIDADALKKEAAKEEYQKAIDAHAKLAADLYIQGTPALIINDQLINSALRLDALKEEVAKARNTN